MMQNEYPTQQEATAVMNQLFCQKNEPAAQYYYGYNGGYAPTMNPMGYNDPNSRINSSTYPTNPYQQLQQPQQQSQVPPQAPLYNPYQQQPQFPTISQRTMPTLNMSAIDGAPQQAPTFSNPYPQYQQPQQSPMMPQVPTSYYNPNSYYGQNSYMKKPDTWFNALTPVRQNIPAIDWNTPVQGSLQNPYQQVQQQPQYIPPFQAPTFNNPGQFQTNWVDTWNANRNMSY